MGGRDCRGACAAITAAAAEISAVAFAVGFRPDLAAWFIPLGTALALSAVAAREHARGEVAAEAAVAASAGAINDWDKTALAGADHTVLAAPGAPVLRARGTCCAAVRACCGAPAGTPVWRRGADALHAVVWVAASAALLLCVGGSMTVAVGWRWFAPRGAFYAVAAGGDTVSMHAWCVGPPPSVNATIFSTMAAPAIRRRTSTALPTRLPPPAAAF